MLAHPDQGDIDSGPRSSGPERLCVATRTVRPVAGMIRFVIGPDCALVPDIKRKLPGRGVWVTANVGALTVAIERKAFARSFKREVRVQPDLVDLVGRLLERAALDALGIVHKAGRVVTGFTGVAAALDSAPVVGLLHASDASADGLRKLSAAAKRRFGDDHLPIIALFSTAQLDLALGRSNVVHAALLAGPASAGFLTRCRSLECFRSGDPEVRGRAAHGRKRGAV
jgi:uncharacterized protein